MKLLRLGERGNERPGILDNSGNVRDLSHIVTEINPTSLADTELWNRVQNISIDTCPLASQDSRIGPPIETPGKLIFAGFNSQKHAEELGFTVNDKLEPILFMKPPSAIAGPNDAIIYGKQLKKLDWEAELAIVIGKQGRYIPESDAEQYIFGYTCCNDLSDRYLQFELMDKQFTKGKCFDGSAPLGPYLVTKDEITNASSLDIQLWVNGELRQDFNTADYILNDKQLVSYISHYFTLYPGDVISMGSAPGCAKTWGDSYLLPDDIVELSITQLGRQKQCVRAE